MKGDWFMYAEVYGRTCDGQYIGVMTTYRSDGAVFDKSGFYVRGSVPFAEVVDGITEVDIVSILTTGEVGISEVYFKGEVISIRAGLSTVLLRFNKGNGCVTMPLRRRIEGDKDISFATQVYLVYESNKITKKAVDRALSGMSVVRPWKRIVKCD